MYIIMSTKIKVYIFYPIIVEQEKANSFATALQRVSIFECIVLFIMLIFICIILDL